MKWMAGHIYNGGAIDELTPFKTRKDAEEYVKSCIPDKEEVNIDDWETLDSNIKIKHYYVDYNTYFIMDLRKAEN